MSGIEDELAIECCRFVPRESERHDARFDESPKSPQDAGNILINGAKVSKRPIEVVGRFKWSHIELAAGARYIISAHRNADRYR